MSHEHTALAVTESKLPVLTNDQNIVDLYINSLPSPQSQRTMLQALARITDILSDREPSNDTEQHWIRAREFQWHRLNSGTVDLIKSRLSRPIKLEPGKGPDGQPVPRVGILEITTANKLLSAIRGVFKSFVVHTDDQMEKERLASVYSAIKLVRNFRRDNEAPLRGRSLSQKELECLAETVQRDLTLSGLRNAALLTVAYGTGLRRAEIVALNIEDWDAEENKIRVRHGKGNKKRDVYLSAKGALRIERWIAARMAPAPDSPLFVGISKRKHEKDGTIRSGKIVERRLTDQSIYDIFQQLYFEAGIQKEFSPHDLRRSFISDLLDRGVDLMTVSKLAGHSDPATTEKYDRRGEEAKKAAATKLDIPF